LVASRFSVSGFRLVDSYLRERSPLGCRRRIEAMRTARPRRTNRRVSGLPVVAAASRVLVAGRTSAFGVPSTPRTSPPEDWLLVLEALDSVPDTSLVVVSLDDSVVELAVVEVSVVELSVVVVELSVVEESVVVELSVVVVELSVVVVELSVVVVELSVVLELCELVLEDDVVVVSVQLSELDFDV
jgi:hypothetical protein